MLFPVPLPFSPDNKGDIDRAHCNAWARNFHLAPNIFYEASVASGLADPADRNNAEETRPGG